MPTQITFKAILQDTDQGGAYVFVPLDIKKHFGTTGRVAVLATINGEPYRGSIMKYGGPEHMLVILKSIRQKLQLQAGDQLTITLEKDTEKRQVTLPEDLQKMLNKKASLRTFFDKLSYSHQREYVEWINSAKKAETRQKRLAAMMEMLSQQIKTPK